MSRRCPGGAEVCGAAFRLRRAVSPPDLPIRIVRGGLTGPAQRPPRVTARPTRINHSSTLKRAPLLLILACAALLPAQEISVEKPTAPFIVRPWIPTHVPPIVLRDSPRLDQLIRGGSLYLTVQDAIALAIENNLDLEVDRYGPLNAAWLTQRAEAGGLLRGVTTGKSQVGQVASGQGVSGSQAAAGLGGSNGGGGGGGGGAVVSQIGPVTENLDPILTNTTLFSHTTSPQNVGRVQSQVAALIDTSHIYNTTLQQGFLTGGYITLSQSESYLKENTPTDLLNPSVAPRLQFYAQHNLLQGFGTAVNSRFIRVARNNQRAADFTFRSQLLNVVANVLNLYWDLVTDNDDLKAKQTALEMSRKFLADTNKEIELGVVARADIYSAKAEVATREIELAISQATVRQQENLLKMALVRDAALDPRADEAAVVPLDAIQIPTADELPPFRSLLTRALGQRPDIAVSRINDESAEISALGTASGLLPNAQGFATVRDSGLAGTPNYAAGAPLPTIIGGLGTSFGQIFRRDFPSQQVGGYIVANFGNHVAQGDYGIDQLQLRQTQLSGRRDLNQLVVDISNQMVALRQARSRYSAAVDTRTLQEDLLEKEQQAFSLGTATINDVVVVQRSLVAARFAEVAALGTYARARVALDQVVGDTLAKNHVSVDDALQGHVAQAKSAP